MNRASPAPRSKASPKTPPTASWPRSSGMPCSACRASSSTRPINTADSMIGHKSERYSAFRLGRGAARRSRQSARSRLTGLLFAAQPLDSTSSAARSALHAMWRDAPKHLSPNAGWPEAALAAALDIKLGGPRSYDGRTVDLPWMGDGRADLTRDDIRRGLKLYGRAMTSCCSLWR